MKNIRRFRRREAFLSCLSMLCVLLFSTGAFAQIEGCKPEVLEGLHAKAQAKVAYDVASTEQILVKPDSVLALTCFNRSAGVSAERGGNLFSGSFISNPSFQSLIGDMLNAFFGQFADAEGFDSATVSPLYSATGLEDNPECSGIEDLWTRFKEKGVTGGVPYVNFQDLIDGVLPAGAGPRFQLNWEAAEADDIFGRLNTAMGNLPEADIPSLTGLNRVCEVLNALDIVVPCP